MPDRQYAAFTNNGDERRNALLRERDEARRSGKIRKVKRAAQPPVTPIPQKQSLAEAQAEARREMQKIIATL